jgi:hypothetical protein
VPGAVAAAMYRTTDGTVLARRTVDERIPRPRGAAIASVCGLVVLLTAAIVPPE